MTLPETGEYKGEPIDLGHAKATLSPAELAQVFVDVPGSGKIRPWRFIDDPKVTITPDGSVEIG